MVEEFRALRFAVGSFLFAGISFTCLTISVAFIAQVVRAIHITRLPQWRSAVRSRRRVGTYLPTSAKRRFRNKVRSRCLRYIDRSYWFPEYQIDRVLVERSISKIVLSLLALIASLLYGPPLTYLLLYAQIPSMLDVYGISLPNIFLSDLISVIILILTIVLMTSVAYISHIFAIEEGPEKIVVPQLESIRFHKQFGWESALLTFIIRLSIIWFILESFYNIVFGMPLILAGDLEQWMKRFSLSVFPPSVILSWYYFQLDREIARRQSEESDLDFSEWRSEYPVVDKFYKIIAGYSLKIADTLGLTIRQIMSKTFSYVYSIFTILIVVTPFEYILTPSLFNIFLLPVIVALIILVVNGFRNLVKDIRRRGQNYVQKSKEDRSGKSSKEYEINILTMEKARERGSEITKNTIYSYVIFLLSVVLLDLLPMTAITYLDNIARTTTVILSDLIAFSAGIPSIFVEPILNFMLQTPHPGEFLFIFVVNIPTLYFLTAAVHHVRSLHEELIYYILERYNPHERETSTKESLSSLGRDLGIMYTLMSLFPLLMIIVLLIIHLIFSLF